MEDSYYIVIQGWMRRLGLTGNDLLVFAFINGYSQQGQGAYYGSLPALCEACGIARRTAIDVLARLTEQGYLVKSETWHNGVRYCSYQVRVGGGAESARVVQNLHGGGAESAPNNKSNNKSSLSIEREARAREERGGKFVKPTVSEVAAYAAEKGIVLDADHFVAHYTSNGWKVGKAPMKDWRAAVVAWSKREGEFRRPAPATAAQTAEDVAKHPNAVWDRLAKEGRI